MKAGDEATRPRAPSEERGGSAAGDGLHLRLVFTEGERPLPEAEVEREWGLAPGVKVGIGREPGDGGIALRGDAWSSRRHATASMFVFGSDRGVLVEDHDSVNGTWVDGVRVQGRILAKVGSVLRVGSSLLVVGRSRASLSPGGAPSGWHMRTAAMREVWQRAMAIASTDDPALLLGEPGTGKTRLAQLMHERSPRRGGPFVPMNASAIPLHLEEATLFGVVGGFIPNVKKKEGLLSLARHGTLFLDELADMPLVAQAKLLDAFDPMHRSFLPVGASSRVPTECRLIGATNRDPFEMVRRGELRHDLMSRLVVGEMVVPPLRERREDLLTMFSEAVGRAGIGGAVRPSVEAAEAMLLARWTENVRGLESFVRRLVHGVPLTVESVRAHADRGADLGSAASAMAAPEVDSAASGTGPRGLPSAASGADTSMDWPPSELGWFELLERHQWNVNAVADALRVRRETAARQLTKTFGKGGKSAAKRAFTVWRETGRLPPGS